MINIIITENEIPTFTDIKSKREKMIAPQVQRITGEAINEISASLKQYFRGSYDIMKSESNWLIQSMNYDELAELAEDIGTIFEQRGFKVEIQSFSPNYKVFRRVCVSI